MCHILGGVAGAGISAMRLSCACRSRTIFPTEPPTVTYGAK
jgi:hypothetical protein